MPLDFDELSRRKLRFAIEELIKSVKELTKTLKEAQNARMSKM